MHQKIKGTSFIQQDDSTPTPVAMATGATQAAPQGGADDDAAGTCSEEEPPGGSGRGSRDSPGGSGRGSRDPPGGVRSGVARPPGGHVGGHVTPRGGQVGGHVHVHRSRRREKNQQLEGRSCRKLLPRPHPQDNHTWHTVVNKGPAPSVVRSFNSCRPAPLDLSPWQPAAGWNSRKWLGWFQTVGPSSCRQNHRSPLWSSCGPAEVLEPGPALPPGG